MRSANIAIALALRLLPAAASLAPALAAPPDAHAAEPASSGVVLVVDGAPWDIEPEAVRAAVARELGEAVTLSSEAPAGKASLVLRGESGRRVTLTYHAADGRQAGRSLDLPNDPDRSAEIIALLAVNLARDEAAELAAALGEPPPGAAPTAEPTATAPIAPIAPIAPNPQGTPTASGPPAGGPPAARPPAGKPASAGRAKTTPPARPAPQKPPPCSLAGAPVVLVGADFVPSVGTSTQTGTNVVRRYSFNLLGGAAAGLTGVEIGGVFNVETAFMCGAQASSMANVVAGPARGAQLSGGLNYARSLSGAQLGLANIAAGPVSGVQAGLLDIAGTTRGAQAGLLNVAAGDLQGAQLGLANIATGNAHGAQLGLANVATGEVKGTQIGMFNYADRSTVSLGLLNIIRHGRTHLDVWGQESGLLMAGVEHGSDHLHNIYGAGVRVVGDRPRVAFALGLGGHFDLGEHFYLDLDALAYGLHDVPDLDPVALLSQARLLIGLRITRGFSLFAGPGYTVSYGLDGDDLQLSPYGSTLLVPDETNPVRGWPGVTVGLRAF